MPDEDPLATVVLDQKRWSRTANQLKASIGRARWIVLALAVLGAVLETWGAQIHNTNAGGAQALGYMGAAALAIAAVVRQWRLGHERTQAWIMTRSGSESLKREMYLFRTSTGPYASRNPSTLLLNRREEILSKLRPFQKYRLEPKGEVKTPGPLDAKGYLEERIQGKATGQIPWYTSRAEEYSGTQRLLTGTEFVLAVIGASFGAALTLTGKQAYGAWVAVITTISGVIAAHVLAQHYEQLTISYRVAADRLAGIVARWSVQGSGSMADLVEPCEAVLLEENQGWIAGPDEAAKDTLPPAPREKSMLPETLRYSNPEHPEGPPESGR